MTALKQHNSVMKTKLLHGIAPITSWKEWLNESEPKSNVIHPTKSTIVGCEKLPLKNGSLKRNGLILKFYNKSVWIIQSCTRELVRVHGVPLVSPILPNLTWRNFPSLFLGTLNSPVFLPEWTNMMDLRWGEQNKFELVFRHWRSFTNMREVGT